MSFENLSNKKYEKDQKNEVEKIRSEIEAKYRKMILENKLDIFNKKEIESLKEDVKTANPSLSDEELEKEVKELWVQVKTDEEFNMRELSN